MTNDATLYASLAPLCGIVLHHTKHSSEMSTLQDKFARFGESFSTVAAHEARRLPPHQCAVML